MFFDLNAVVAALPDKDPYAAFAQALLCVQKGEGLAALEHMAASAALDAGVDARKPMTAALAAHVLAEAARHLAGNDEAAVVRVARRVLALAPDEAPRARALIDAAVHRVLERGVAAHNAGRIGEAGERYRDALALDPTNFDARHMLALTRKHAGDPMTCLRELSALVGTHPYDGHLHYNLSNTIAVVLAQARSAAAQGMLHAAEEAFEAVAHALDGVSDPAHPLSRGGYEIDPAAPAARRAELVYANVHGHILHEDFLNYLPRDARVFECGGADGEDSVALAALFHDGVVYTVEGSVREFGILSRRVDGVPNIKAFNLLISEKPEERTFYVLNADIGRNTMAPPPSDQREAFTAKTVRATSVDAWAADNGVDRIDLFWLDMEGFELKALRGAEAMLSNAGAVYAEVSDDRLHGDPEACRFDELRDWLATRGFVVEQEWRPWRGGGNVLFVRRELSRRRPGAAGTRGLVGHLAR